MADPALSWRELGSNLIDDASRGIDQFSRAVIGNSVDELREDAWDLFESIAPEAVVDQVETISSAPLRLPTEEETKELRKSTIKNTKSAYKLLPGANDFLTPLFGFTDEVAAYVPDLPLLSLNDLLGEAYQNEPDNRALLIRLINDYSAPFSEAPDAGFSQHLHAIEKKILSMEFDYSSDEQKRNILFSSGFMLGIFEGHKKEMPAEEYAELEAALKEQGNQFEMFAGVISGFVLGLLWGLITDFGGLLLLLAGATLVVPALIAMLGLATLLAGLYVMLVCALIEFRKMQHRADPGLINKDIKLVKELLGSTLDQIKTATSGYFDHQIAKINATIEWLTSLSEVYMKDPDRFMLAAGEALGRRVGRDLAKSQRKAMWSENGFYWMGYSWGFNLGYIVYQLIQVLLLLKGLASAGGKAATEVAKESTEIATAQSTKLLGVVDDIPGGQWVDNMRPLQGPSPTNYIDLLEIGGKYVPAPRGVPLIPQARSLARQLKDSPFAQWLQRSTRQPGATGLKNQARQQSSESWGVTIQRYMTGGSATTYKGYDDLPQALVNLFDPMKKNLPAVTGKMGTPTVPMGTRGLPTLSSAVQEPQRMLANPTTTALQSAAAQTPSSAMLPVLANPLSRRQIILQQIRLSYGDDIYRAFQSMGKLSLDMNTIREVIALMRAAATHSRTWVSVNAATGELMTLTQLLNSARVTSVSMLRPLIQRGARTPDFRVLLSNGKKVHVEVITPTGAFRGARTPGFQQWDDVVAMSASQVASASGLVRGGNLVFGDQGKMVGFTLRDLLAGRLPAAFRSKLKRGQINANTPGVILAQVFGEVSTGTKLMSGRQLSELGRKLSSQYPHVEELLVSVRTGSTNLIIRIAGQDSGLGLATHDATQLLNTLGDVIAP